MKMDDFSIVDKYLTFMQKCNTETTDLTTYCIVKNVFNHIGKENFPSINKLAELSNVSKSSISRFVSNYGFENYTEFRNFMANKISNMDMIRRLLKNQEFYGMDNEEIINTIYESYLNNLQTTKKNLDLKKINKIISLIKKCSDLTIVGNERDLDEFNMLQLDLIASGKPAFLFKIPDIEKFHSLFFNENSVVIIVNVSERFLSSFKSVLENAKKTNIKIIYISQDLNKDIEEIVDVYYQYGIPESNKDGYISLCFLGKIIDNLYVNE